MNYIPSIKIFASDFKIRDKWNLPFIRIGVTSECNSVIHDNVKNTISHLELPVSELAPIYFVLNNLSEFGTPDYIGFCHYRRFFTDTTQHPVKLYKTDNVPSNEILTPEQQLALICHFKVDGILPFPLLEHYKQDPTNKKYTYQPKNIVDYFYQQLEDDNTGLKPGHLQVFFDNLIRYSPPNIKDAIQSCTELERVYFGTIFTMKRELVEIWWDIIWKTIQTSMIKLGHDRLMNMNCRVIGYILERLTSCILHGFKLTGRKFISLPLIVANYDDSPIYRHQTTLEKNMKCNIEGLKEL